ncbi:MAG: hypothetical protein JXA21_12350 [Anaerolineae bacterium]|nr:hypothetical protein [Anaerolineae bacterium]
MDNLTLIISFLGALTSLYSVWLSRHKALAEAKKTAEEAESEDVRQRGTEIDNLRAINDEWQRQYGFVVQRMDGFKAELDQEIKRRQGVESSAAERITELEQLFAAERAARMESDKRAQAQAQHIVAMQDEIKTLKAENKDLLGKIKSQDETIFSLNATIASLQRINEDKERQIASLRRDLSAMKVDLRANEVRSKCSGEAT